MSNKISISKNCYRGEQIKDEIELINQAENKRSVYHVNYGIKPASVIVNMSFRMVMDMIALGKLYRVEKREKDE